MKKYIYIGILSVVLIMAYAGFNLFNDSFAAGNYSYYSRYKSGVGFKIGNFVHRAMGYFVLEDTGGNKTANFCGSYGKSIWSGSNKTYTRYDFDSYYASKGDNWKTRLRNILLLYKPDINSDDQTSLNALKGYLSTNFPTIYASKGLANLTVAETTATFQAAIWYFTNDQNWVYSGNSDTPAYIRTMALYNILKQSSSYLPNINSYMGSANFRIISALQWADSNIVTTIGPKAGSTFDYNSNEYSITFKTNTGIIINTNNYTQVYDSQTGGMIYTLQGITQNMDSKLVYNDNVFDSLVAYITAVQPNSDRRAYVYVPDTNNNYQIYFGSESNPITSSQSLMLPAPEITKVSVRFNKVDLNNLSGSNLQGGYLKLYRVENSSRVLIQEWVTGLSYYEIANLPVGTYVIEETITPSGYLTVNNYSNLDEINKTLYVSSNKNFEINGNTQIINVVNKKTSLNILKQDLKNNNITGARFNIIDRNGDIYYTFTSSNTAVSIEGKLETGVYFLEEIEAPTNFKKSESLYRFAIGDIDASELVSGRLPGLSNDVDVLHPDKKYSERTIVDVTFGANNTITIPNEKGVVITKRDIANTNLYVIGATLTITNRTTNDVVESWVTTNSEKLVFLPDGDYTLTETVTPGGYATAESIDFTVQDGEVTNNTNLNMKDARLNVCIAKRATDIVDNLAGAEFEVYNSDGELVASFTSGMDEYCFNNDTSKAITNDEIKPGIYTIKEVKAPRGYKYKKQTTQIEIKNISTLQLFEIVNETEVPKTSLDVSKIIYISAIVMGTFGIGMIIYYVKKYSY